ncbi:hypothetical protein K461DRAFT_276243 [Myriangium duriaei CBS 260.36]|uniref:Uncharacterized protein n=1 Tax=Myriangium duriaei CBS 260.36 TaxID=1168546 RepID=A0A9P4MMC4_9PEZI|nr:hypothetical protein K461DRAFT_276243 [Myriangium duriaei CBS 260.36]
MDVHMRPDTGSYPRAYSSQPRTARSVYHRNSSNTPSNLGASPLRELRAPPVTVESEVTRAVCSPDHKSLGLTDCYRFPQGKQCLLMVGACTKSSISKHCWSQKHLYTCRRWKDPCRGKKTIARAGTRLLVKHSMWIWDPISLGTYQTHVLAAR